MASPSPSPSPSPAISLLVGILCGVFFVALGLWQLHRAAEKHDYAARQQWLAQQPPQFLMRLDSVAAEDWQQVRLRGRYNPAMQWLVDNHSLQGRPGYLLYSVFALATSTEQILVQRGWLPSQQPLPSSLSSLPSGPLEIQGVLREPSVPPLALGAIAAEDVVAGVRRIHRLDLLALRSWLPQLETQRVLVLAADSALAYKPWPVLPAVSPARHYGYAVQWFVFALLSVVLAVMLPRRRRLEGVENGD